MAAAAQPTHLTQAPLELSSAIDALNKALAEAVPGAWNEDDKYAAAEQPQAIARALVRALSEHSHLKNAKIGFLFKKDMKKTGCEIWGHASRVGGKLAHYSHLDFLIEINWSQWMRLSPARRIALLDHELKHCGRTEDGWCMLPHDLEEFNAIVRRWGSWRPQVAHFVASATEGQQFGLFPHD